ncbi:hypothetical protein Kpol_1033p63 [Vanderwaltozyma polyspora DSM 70294]|uniref:Protein kinase domain-containing protein n=1 Tax=Vanderwaltozyma polyspora (strain ATCC 22028 / DSM 70294 / BCRC 21397 / CBS 2163 / NBRC 10782 / NRRL Y-8283 / UCD 57-17) TaxID=436907 RepID=A7TJ57_VANPO|nr:uncharacterized protein Kpol_1033p63 [Vanderwaltozyma polyspora DSM 70294]EDO17756.1 hypothetical protein Kpol_1033p63 [Vanderwaltozyma polyspora DSM 70294]
MSGNGSSGSNDMPIYGYRNKGSPKAPKLSQTEFDDDDVGIDNSTEKLHLDTDIAISKDNPHTPLMIQIPAFDNIQTLPTPMTYTPSNSSSTTRSPVNTIHVAKRRRDPAISRKLNDISNLHQQRVISELPPLPLGQSQRIVSLPTVNEEQLPGDSNKLGQKIVGKPHDIKEDSDVLEGYLLPNMDGPYHWRIVREIGAGNFSTVYLYELIDDRISDTNLRYVAVKRIKYPQEMLRGASEDNPSYKDTLSRFESSLTRELSVLQSLNHPCIIKLLGVNDPVFVKRKRPLNDLLAQSPTLPPCNIITSYCSGGDLLAAAMQFAGKLDNWLIQRIFSEVTLAVKYLHENDVIHRDLKLENILLKYPIEYIIREGNNASLWNQNIIELADFGLCKKIEPDEMCTARCGSEDYVSPEILMGVPYDGKLSDTWALGVILYALLEDRLPFDPPPNAMARQRNRSTSHRIARFEWKWNKMNDIESDAKEIVTNSLTRKSSRWNIEQIYESKYVQEIISNLNINLN